MQVAKLSVTYTPASTADKQGGNADRTTVTNLKLILD